MNHNEIEACVIRAKTGSNEDLLKILEQFKPFIFKTARQFNIKSFDVYDLSQIGYIALINAVIKYKIGSHTFSSYAFNAIKNGFRYAARKNSKFTNDLSLNSTIESKDNTITEYIDCIESDENLEEEIIHSEDIREVRTALSKLSEDEMEFVIMIYYSGVSVSQFAKKKGLSYNQALKKKKYILEKLGLLING